MTEKSTNFCSFAPERATGRILNYNSSCLYNAFPLCLPSAKLWFQYNKKKKRNNGTALWKGHN